MEREPEVKRVESVARGVAHVWEWNGEEPKWQYRWKTVCREDRLTTAEPPKTFSKYDRELPDPAKEKVAVKSRRVEQVAAAKKCPVCFGT